MSTTSLFVELIVVGVGAAIWLALLTLALFGYEWVQVPADKALSIPAAIPILAVVYVLGIVSDRMIDILFHRLWGTKLRSQQFPDTKDYYEASRVS